MKRALVDGDEAEAAINHRQQRPLEHQQQKKKRKLRKGKKKSKAERLARGVTTPISLSPSPSEILKTIKQLLNTHLDAKEIQSTSSSVAGVNGESKTCSQAWDEAQELALQLNSSEAKILIVQTLLYQKQMPKAAAHYAKRLQMTEDAIITAILTSASTIDGATTRSSSTERIIVAKFLAELPATMVSNRVRLENFVWPWLQNCLSDKDTSVAIRLLLMYPPAGKKTSALNPKHEQKGEERAELQRLLVEKCLETGELLHLVAQYVIAFCPLLQKCLQVHQNKQESGELALPTDQIVVEKIWNNEQSRRHGVTLRLEQLLQLIWPDAHVVIFGSSSTGLLRCSGNNGDNEKCVDDLDLCVLLPSNASLVRQATASLVVEMKEHLEVYMSSYQDMVAIEGARIPIIQFTDAESQLKCDVCINNIPAIWNTALMRFFLDDANRMWSVQIRSVLQWLKRWRDAKKYVFGSGISSYGMQLLVIYYFQRRGVLPAVNCEQFTGNHEEPLTSLNVDSCYRRLQALAQAKRMEKRDDSVNLSWWGAVIDFFQFYAIEFDFEHTVVSLRFSETLTKETKQWKRKSWKTALSIEDPVEVDRDLGTLFNRKILAKLRCAFAHACVLLSKENQTPSEQAQALLSEYPYELQHRNQTDPVENGE